MPRADFTNRYALVTGGTSGIGYAIARELVLRGSHVWLLARTEAKLTEARGLLQAARVHAGQFVGTVAADVSSLRDVEEAVERILAESGRIDILVNSAGAAHPGYVHELKADVYRWMMDVNYYGTVHMTKAVLPSMLGRRSGHIVNISSLAGIVSIFGYSAYAASKFAVRGFSDALRAEVGPRGIGVSIVFPPDTDTPQLAYENRHKPVETKALGGTGGLLTPEQVARHIVVGVGRGRYVILPGSRSKVIYWLSNLLGPLTFPILDWLVARSRRREG